MEALKAMEGETPTIPRKLMYKASCTPNPLSEGMKKPAKVITGKTKRRRQVIMKAALPPTPNTAPSPYRWQ